MILLNNNGQHKSNMPTWHFKIFMAIWNAHVMVMKWTSMRCKSTSNLTFCHASNLIVMNGWPKAMRLANLSFLWTFSFSASHCETLLKKCPKTGHNLERLKNSLFLAVLYKWFLKFYAWQNDLPDYIVVSHCSEER